MSYSECNKMTTSVESLKLDLLENTGDAVDGVWETEGNTGKVTNVGIDKEDNAKVKEINSISLSHHWICCLRNDLYSTTMAGLYLKSFHSPLRKPWLVYKGTLKSLGVL